MGLSLADIDKVSAVTFDFGGTLARYGREAILKRLLEEQGFSPSTEAISEAYEVVDLWWDENYAGRVPEERWNQRVIHELDLVLLTELGIRERAEGLARWISNKWSEAEPDQPFEVFPDTLPALSFLKSRGYSMAVISNTPSLERLKRVVDGLSVSQFFRSLIASGTVGFSKPDERIFRLAADALAKPPREILHIGDSYEGDVLGATRAGFKAILLDRANKSRKVNVQFPVIDSLAKLEEMLR